MNKNIRNISKYSPRQKLLIVDLKGSLCNFCRRVAVMVLKEYSYNLALHSHNIVGLTLDRCNRTRVIVLFIFFREWDALSDVSQQLSLEPQKALYNFCKHMQ